MFAKKITWKLRNEDLDHLYRVSSRRKSAFKLPISIIDDHVILTDKLYDTMKLVRKDIDKNGLGFTEKIYALRKYLVAYRLQNSCKQTMRNRVKLC